MKTIGLAIEVLKYLSRLSSLKKLMLCQQDPYSVTLDLAEFLVYTEEKLVLEFWPGLNSGDIEVFSEYHKSRILYSFDATTRTLTIISSFRNPIKYYITGFSESL